MFDAAGRIERPELSGQVEGLAAGLSARLTLRGAAGEVIEDAPCDASDHASALRVLLQRLHAQGPGGSVVAVGHRIVHGGPAFDRPMRIDAALVDALAALEPLAPLHQPHNVAGVRAAMAAFADALHVACFDTAFHRSQPAVHQRFALPEKWFDAGVRRYGFHGLSYESVVAQLGERRHGKVVVAHLGNGASLCAIEDGRSIATTMSFSPLDGLTMGTRCGRIDAAAVLHLQSAHGLSVDEVTKLLYRESGLLGLSGISSDMRVLEASANPRAQLAIDHFVEQLLQSIAAMAAALNGIDTLVFTAGIGENAVALRSRVVGRLGWLGLVLDEHANASGGPRISSPQSAVGTWVLRTDEEVVIARHTAAQAVQ